MLFITRKVFDPTLKGMAAFISGYDTEGVLWNETYLVTGTEGEYIHLIGINAKTYKLHMENFEHEEGLKLQILELPQPKEISLPFDDLDIAYDLEDEPIKKKYFRSDLQIKVDNNHLEYMLQENIEPMKLEDITRRMRDNHGHWHWNAKNASGFVQHAIKCGKQIKKVGYAYYGFDWEAGL